MHYFYGKNIKFVTKLLNFMAVPIKRQVEKRLQPYQDGYYKSTGTVSDVPKSIKALEASVIFSAIKEGEV